MGQIGPPQLFRKYGLHAVSEMNADLSKFWRNGCVENLFAKRYP